MQRNQPGLLELHHLQGPRRCKALRHPLPPHPRLPLHHPLPLLRRNPLLNPHRCLRVAPELGSATDETGRASWYAALGIEGVVDKVEEEE